MKKTLWAFKRHLNKITTSMLGDIAIMAMLGFSLALCAAAALVYLLEKLFAMFL